ncbi:MAG: 2-polyprenylphenol 6-hydroxylase [Alphaproteobacteria bacterium]|nr:2-polyprenylphenol 6-hydroxylase [Alphaproteobacteria bacterium]
MRLIRAGFVLAREGALSLGDPSALPASARMLIRMGRLIERGSVRKTGRVERLTRALTRLGPTYVKFGQMLATRPDIVGPQIAEDLSALQDRMPPFPEAAAQRILKDALGSKADALSALTPAIAAASIAQVHKAVLDLGDGRTEPVAVKILRPGIEKRFRRDLESYYAGARLAERLVPSLKRLRPVSVVETLDHSARLELDLRFEAASISEFAENGKNDEGFVLPELRWDQVAPNVLTTSWIEGIPLTDKKAVAAADIDRKALAAHLLQSFLRHAIRDGFFHADMHPGNLFALENGNGLAAVDFGIMGRIGPGERRFLAEILFGFITRDYSMVARRHFEMGYVPADQSVDDFTLAIRSIGEPLHGRRSRDISMARVLGQLFSITELFHMQTRPELLMLQKTMVLVEGVARDLDPDLDIWTVSEPVVAEWLRRQAGPIGRFEEMRAHGMRIAGFVARLPEIAERAQRLLVLAEAEKAAARRGRSGTIAGLLGLIALLLALLIWRLW